MDRRSAWLLLVLFVAACGNSDDGGGNAPSPEVASGGADIGTDLPTKNDAATDGSGEEVSDGPPPWFGIACETSPDCPSGWCVQGQCTDVCIDSCPNGWICKSLTGTGADVTFVCVPDGDALCNPCASDQDCTAGGLHCVQLGDEGTFCAIRCDATAVGCPTGYACTEKSGAAFCLPVSGNCDCTDDNLGEVQSCSLVALEGQCPGTKTCTKTGWTGCSAQESSDESCNGKDDDCDGLVDEEGAAGCTMRWVDADGDAYGAGTPKCLCATIDGYVAPMGGDCDDSDAQVHPGTAELCNGDDDDCDGATDEETGGKVCQVPGDASSCPGETQCTDGVLTCAGKTPAPETCNGVDDDCDGTADEGTSGGACVNESAFGVCPGTYLCAGQAGLVCSAKSPAVESCNGADDDCDGATDPEGAEGCTPYYADADGDGFGASAGVKCLCKPGAPYTAPAGDDCDDGKKAVHPGAAEACNGDDDDCNGSVDEGADGKLCTPEGGGSCPGVTVCTDGVLACAGKTPAPETCNGIDDDCDGTADNGTSGGACDVTNAFGSCSGTALCAGAQGPLCTAKTPALEACNGADDDCDGVIDPAGAEGCTTFYADADGDGFGVSLDATCLCKPAGPYTASNDGDCDDALEDVHPGSAEVCNGIDDDCNAVADDGADGKLCIPPGGGTCPGVTVCADGLLTCEGKATQAEVCNGIDDDCDGVADDGTGGAACENANAFGTCTGLAACNGADGLSCSAKTPAPESCNGADDDCDGAVDPAGADGCTTYYADGDGDGFGDAADAKCLCAPSAPYTALTSGDCDDTQKKVHPGAAETCNAVDDDCSGAVDEGTGGKLCQVPGGPGACPGVTACLDGELECTGKAPSAEVCNGIDDDCNGVADNGTSGGACSVQNAAGACVGTYACNGAAGLVCSAKTPAAESCNGLDDDCNGAVDPAGAAGCLTFHADADGDGFGSDVATACLCKASAAFPTLVGGDCNDQSKPAHPGAVESCNGVDDDCNGLIDSENALGCTSYFADADGDGFGAVGQTKCLCAPVAPYNVKIAGDCNDGDAAIKPGGVEICDGKDQTCEGVVDEGCDQDGDGWCVLGATVVGAPPACKNGTGDCNDANAGVHPTKAEICNGVDENCNGQIDEGVASPCGGCSSFCQMGIGPGTPQDWSSDPNDFNGTKPDANAHLVLGSDTIQFRTIWVANSADDTVSKIDTPTGKELARYVTCDDPSRTAVSGDGSVWIACRGDGKVAHIALDEAKCVDKNGNGKIDTSRDMNGDGTISGTELLGSGKDECVLLIANPDGGSNIARALGVDKDGYPWVGYWTSKHVRKIDPVTGASLALVNLSSAAGSPYGLAIDKNGTVWVATRDSGRLLAIDTSKASLPVTTYTPPSGLNTYGIAVDVGGHVWLGTGEGKKVLHFNPTTAKFTTISTASSYGHTRGVAASTDGYVYVAHYDWDNGCDNATTSRRVSKIEAATDKVVGNFDLGGAKGPVGVAIDFDGYVWAVNQCSWTASKLDPKTMKVVGEYPTGKTPYTYSDMTGYALKTVVAPSGSYTQTFEGWATGKTQWLVVSPTVTLPGASTLEVRYRTAATKAGLAAVAWSAWGGPFPPAALPWAFPNDATAIGRFMQLELMLKSNGSTVSPVLKQIQVMAGQVP